MTGKRIKQINNLVIRYTDMYQYSVWTPDGRCWEDRMTLEQAEEFCRNTKDFVRRSLTDKLTDAQERSAETHRADVGKDEFLKG